MKKLNKLSIVVTSTLLLNTYNSNIEADTQPRPDTSSYSNQISKKPDPNTKYKTKEKIIKNNLSTPKEIPTPTTNKVLADWSYTEDNNTITLNKYNGSNQTLIIPGQISGKQVKITYNMLKDLKDSTVTNLDIREQNGIKVSFEGSSLRSALSDNKSLISVDLNGLNISNVTDISLMFSNCPLLSTAKLNDWDTSSINMMYSTFSNCPSLNTVDISNWNTSNVSGMSSMFSWCTSLKTLDISNWNTDKLTSTANMFDTCRSLSNIDLNHWNMSNVWTIQYMFRGCTSLKNINISNWNTSNVNNMDHVFTSCSSLENLDIKNWNTSKVYTLQCMFQSCYNLKNINLNNWNTSNVNNMNMIFRNCQELTNVSLSNWDTTKANNMNLLFAYCPKLTNIDLSNWKTSNVNQLDTSNMFYASTFTTLLVVTQDQGLKNYKYKDIDNRLPVGPTLDANGGNFEDGSTKQVLFETNVVGSLNPAPIRKEISQKLYSVISPTKKDFTFIKWSPILRDTNKTDSLHYIFNLLNTTYQAEYQAEDKSSITLKNQSLTINSNNEDIKKIITDNIKTLTNKFGQDVLKKQLNQVEVKIKNDSGIINNLENTLKIPGKYTVIYTYEGKTAEANLQVREITASKKVNNQQSIPRNPSKKVNNQQSVPRNPSKKVNNQQSVALNRNKKALPQTGNSKNILPILGTILIILGVLVTFLKKLKK